MQQNTADWLEWRRQGLGASDANIIMGVSQYTTRRQLFEIKLGLRKPEGESFITELGHRFEPRARARFAIEQGIDLKADACLTHPEFPFLRASLDGHCPNERVFAEIKMVGKAKMLWLKENKRPIDEHVPQVQQQFLVTGYERGWYIAYELDDKKQVMTDYVAFPVAPDRPYMDMLFKELDAFWTLVKTQTPPELSPKDEYVFKDPAADRLMADYFALKKIAEDHQAKADEMAEKIKALASAHSRVRIGGATITKIVRKGNVDYKKVPQLRGVDLEPFRGAPISMTQIRQDKATEGKE